MKDGGALGRLQSLWGRKGVGLLLRDEAGETGRGRVGKALSTELSQQGLYRPLAPRFCHLGLGVRRTVGAQLLPVGLAEQPVQLASSSQVPRQRGLGPGLLPQEEQRGALTPEARPRLIRPHRRPRPGWSFPAAERGGQGERATQQPEGRPV